MAAHRLERVRRIEEWLVSEGFRSPTKVERQKLAEEIGSDEQRVRKTIKQLRYQHGKSQTMGISPQTETHLRAWITSNNNRLNPSEEEIAALADSICLVRKCDISTWFHKLRALRNTPAIKGTPKKRMRKGTVEKHAIEAWIQAHNGRLWQTEEELDALVQEAGSTRNSVCGSFQYRRRKAMKELTDALVDPRGFIARHGYGVESALREFFEGPIERKEEGKVLVAQLTGLPLSSIEQCLESSDSHRVDEPERNALESPTNCTVDEDVPEVEAIADAPSQSYKRTPSPVSTWRRSPNVDSVHINPDAPKASQAPFASETVTGVSNNSNSDSSRTKADVRADVEKFLQSYPGVTLVASIEVVREHGVGVLIFVSPQCICLSSVKKDWEKAVEHCWSPDFVILAVPEPVYDATIYSVIVSAAGSIPNRERWKCPLCSHSIPSTYETWLPGGPVYKHLNRHLGPFYICPYDDCPLHIARIPMIKECVYGHLNGHDTFDPTMDLLSMLDVVEAKDTSSELTRIPRITLSSNFSEK